MINYRKAVMIGCGFVGSATVFSLMESGLFTDIAMIDIDRDKAEGEAMDISHGVPFARQMKIYAGCYGDVRDAGIVIISAGANQKEGETRLDLVNKNVGILKNIIPEITAANFEGILLIVANPVDVLTFAAWKLSGLPENRVLGSGTVLDTARLKYRIGEEMGVDSKSVHAFIVGEHGDSEIAAWSSASVSGISIREFARMRNIKDISRRMEDISQDVKDSAYEIIKRKQATYYGIAMAVRRICEAVVRDEKSILPVSVVTSGVALSMPCIVGKDGVETVLSIDLDEGEQEKFNKSVEIIEKTISMIKLD